MVVSEIKCSWRAPEALRNYFNSKEMAELPVTPTICLVPVAKTYQSPARRDGGLSPWVLPTSSLSQKPKMPFPVLNANDWFKECCTLCCRLEKSPHCPGKCFPRPDFPPLSTSSQEMPAVRTSPSKAGSANFQLRSELRFVPFAEEFGHVLDFLDAGNAEFLWRLFLGVIACYNVWAQRGVQSSP